MNNDRRKSIRAILATLSELDETIDELTSEEQDAYDNLPESLQDGERGDAMQEAINNLESAKSSLEEMVSYLESAVE